MYTELAEIIGTVFTCFGVIKNTIVNTVTIFILGGTIFERYANVWTMFFTINN